MSSRVALPVLMWSISAAGAEEPPADQPVIDLAVDIVAGTTRPDNIQDAELNGFETELGYDAFRFFAALSYSETRGRDATTGEPLTFVPPDKLVATLGLRLPELGLVFRDLACAWERLRVEEPGVRARDAARKLGVSGAELAASGSVGNAVRLQPDLATPVA